MKCNAAIGCPYAVLSFTLDELASSAIAYDLSKLRSDSLLVVQACQVALIVLTDDEVELRAGERTLVGDSSAWNPVAIALDV